jgi:hypothetical protein
MSGNFKRKLQLKQWADTAVAVNSIQSEAHLHKGIKRKQGQMQIMNLLGCSSHGCTLNGYSYKKQCVTLEGKGQGKNVGINTDVNENLIICHSNVMPDVEVFNIHTYRQTNQNYMPTSA